MFLHQLVICVTFFPKDIKYNNRLIWYSNEQKHKHDKCVEFKDDEIACKIRAAKIAAECNRLEQKMTNYNHAHWMTKTTPSLLEVNKLKYSQYPKLAEFLKKSDTTHIVDVSPFNNKLGIYISIKALTFLLKKNGTVIMRCGRCLWTSDQIFL